MTDLRDIKKRELRNISATQYGTAMDCFRKWFLGWVLGLREPQTDAQKRGNECHDSLEHRVLTGVRRDDPYSRHVEAIEQTYFKGMPLLPEMDESPLVEAQMSIPTVWLPWNGKVDILRPKIFPQTVQDWKSTSDIRYAKTPHEVLHDPQTNSYAEWGFQAGHLDPSRIIRTGLVYVEIRKKPLKRKLPKVVPVLVDVDRAHVRSVWNAIQPNIERMAKIYELDDPHEVPPNTAICPKYGGCAHRERCGISMFQGVSAPRHTPPKPLKTKEIESMSFLANLNGQSQAPASAAPAPQTQPAAPAAGFLQNLGQPAAQPAPAAPAPTEAPAPVTPPAPQGGFLQQVQGATTSAPPAAQPAPAPAQAAAPVQAPAPAPAAPQPPVPPTGIVPPDAPPRETGVQEASSGKKKTTRKKKARASGFTIYMDCAPTKGDTDTVLFDDWIWPLIQEINKWAQTEKQVADQWLLGFGDQKAAMSQGVQMLIGDGTKLPAAMIVSSSSPFAREVLPMLIPHAALVIKATKG